MYQLQAAKEFSCVNRQFELLDGTTVEEGTPEGDWVGIWEKTWAEGVGETVLEAILAVTVAFGTNSTRGGDHWRISGAQLHAKSIIIVM